MKVYDITRTLGKDTLTYPGDYPPEIEQRQSDGITVSRLHISSHAGTHMDAPLHFFEHGRSLDTIPVEHFFFQAWVCDCGNEAIMADKVEKILITRPEVNALLFKTSNWQLSRTVFSEQYISLDEEVAGMIASSGIRLVGIDYLSIEKFDTRSYPVHRLLLSRQILILEDVDLSEVSEGAYQLIALPLKWKHADGAPVRAVLVSW